MPSDSGQNRQIVCVLTQIYILSVQTDRAQERRSLFLFVTNDTLVMHLSKWAALPLLQTENRTLSAHVSCG